MPSATVASPSACASDTIAPRDRRALVILVERGRRSCGRSSARRAGSGAGRRATSSRCRSRRARGGRPARAARAVSRCVPVPFSITALSVISRTSRSGRHAVLGERGADRRDEVGLLELARREVDAALHAGRRRARPATRRSVRQASRSTQSPIATMRPGLLGERDELARRDEAALGMLPADERLERRDRAVADVDDRLVVDAQLAALDGAAQGALGRERSRASRRIASSKTIDRGAAALLGAVHRRVGVADAGPRAVVRPRRRSRCRCSPAGTPRRPRRGTAPRTAPAIRRATARGAGLAVDVLAQDGELVAAEPGDRVGRAQRAAQARRDVAQHASPAAWPKRVVDELEAVEVDEQHGDAAAGAAPARRSACSRRSRNSARLGSPVSGSCSAWWASRDSASLRSETSRVTATTWCGAPLASGTMRAAVSTQRTEPSGRTTRQAPVAVGRPPATSPPIGPASSGWMKPTSAAVRPTSSLGAVAEQASLAGDTYR